MEKIRSLTTIILMMSFFLTIIVGCSKLSSKAVLGDNLAKKIIITVGDEDITMDIMMYYIMQQEAENNYNDIYYTANYGISYWDIEIDEDGTTVKEEIKKYILEMAQLYEVFYQEAKKEGYELTDENIEEAEANAASIWSSMSDNQKKVTGLTEESLIEIFKKISLAMKYYDKIEAEMTIDEEEAVSNIKKEDYKEYSIEMMCLDKMEEVNEEGSMDYVSEKELKAAKKRMKQYKEKIKKGESLNVVLPAEEERIYVQSMTFSEDGQELNETLKEAAKKLDNDEYTGIIDTDDGYVIIRMVDNAITESYDRAVQTAIENAQEEALETVYQEVKKSYQIDIKEELWDQIEIGNLTIDEEEEVVETTGAALAK